MSSSIAAEVFEVLHDLLHLFRARLLESLEAVQPGLTFNEFRILMHTGRHPGITQKELVEHSHTDKAQMARTLAQLQDKGWLERSASEADKRVRCLQLSTRGQQLFDQLRSRREQIATELLSDFPAAQQALLHDLLLQARDSAQATRP
ncbi:MULTISPECIES: MarR family winged helix-turn-helix transcriptional regulator [Comamonas]|uniref:MarR family transcriptional regulator n=1 Tax=Comamonas thiooxydans TaxID=363952 RepID=A0A096EZ18_9BURK|nr:MULTISPECIES: MarR family transcriptional regulator [Comamonas]KGG91283.1 MarR family transcriptional regulator [Comamonas thiooxydans]KGG96896.1 MarR family transcriptional regulator [Comamonas thiooxydans]KGH00778.1 MarR family transcriptional regulator [Comamonas thiooxydans]KGH05417.1 MarR family transcriptional regulator [Comamonas thiooxydans]KGH13283.1 MarR family transcriptional regulator [Comamonas thiooxydans]